MFHNHPLHRLPKIRALAAAAMIVLTLFSNPVAAHEFWMESQTYRPDLGQSVPLRHFIGMKFKGTSYPFVPDWFKSFAVTQGPETSNINGVMGDDPAAQVRFEKPGLKILTFHGTPDKLVFKGWKKFRDYLIFEGLETIVDQYGKTLSQQEKFSEDYVRCAKTLMQVGKQMTGEDRAIGLPLELIAEKNPYGLKTGDVLPVRLLKNGKPLAGALVRILTKVDPEHQKPIRTNSDGRALIPLPHQGPYLLNAVAMLNKTLPAEGQPWLSLWASLSFSVQ